MHGLADGDGQFQDVLAVGNGLFLKIQYLALVRADHCAALGRKPQSYVRAAKSS